MLPILPEITWLITVIIIIIEASLVAQTVNNLPTRQETRSHPWVRRILWRKQCQHSPVFLLAELPQQRSLAGLQFMGPQRAEQD